MKIALAQINPTVGDFDGNCRLVLEAVAAAEARGAALAIFPELALSGYPPKDLLERPAFVGEARAALEGLTAALAGAKTAALVGFPERAETREGRGLYNSAALIDGGQVVHVARKSLLPTYDVFDEKRYFDPATEVAPVNFRGRKLGISICEDIWNDADFWPARLYRADPIEALVRGGAEILLNLSASPYTMEKRHLRPRMLAATAERWRRPLLFVNQVGGQDDLVFDGASLAFDATGAVVARGAEHAGDLIVVDVEARGGDRRSPAAPIVRRGVGAGGAGARNARLRPPLRFFTRAPRSVGRHRLGAGRLPRRARPRPRQRARRRHAVALLVARLVDRRRGAGQEPGDRLHRRLDRADVRRLPRDAGAGARRLRGAGLSRRRGGRRRSRPPRTFRPACAARS